MNIREFGDGTLWDNGGEDCGVMHLQTKECPGLLATSRSQGEYTGQPLPKSFQRNQSCRHLVFGLVPCCPMQRVGVILTCLVEGTLWWHL